MYRSDAAAGAPVPPLEGQPAVLQHPTRDERSPAAPAAAAPPPSPSLVPGLSYGVLSLGLGAAMLPFVVTMVVMLAPMRWLWGASSDRR